ncbi:MAG: phosphoribosylglycinamide formyltransferase [Candidatus Eisenbacteria bacterium]|nr:phosphoribosylglycinamide formyltransferase [Candidatus Eisenbacteria bacterium]
MKKLGLGVLASGRGTNLQAIIDACAEGRIPAEVRVVVSDVENALALDRARRAAIPAVYLPPGKFKTKLDPGTEAAYARCLKEHCVDLVLLAGFMRILHAGFLSQFSGRTMNVHPALLPAFPGLDAQRQALERGVRFTGCTVHFVDESVDGGPIILQAVVPVRENDSVATLSERILKEEHKTYCEAVRLFCEGKLKIDGRKVRILDTPRWGACGCGRAEGAN